MLFHATSGLRGRGRSDGLQLHAPAPQPGAHVSCARCLSRERVVRVSARLGHTVWVCRLASG
eukprot:scaffold2305_cov60-Phaeocystis_antarctica.AAC.1